MATAPRMQNTTGSASGYLKAAVRKDGAASAFSNAIRQAPKDQQQLVSSVLAAVKAEVLDSDAYQLQLDSRTTDAILGRIATLLDTYKSELVDTDLAEAKAEIIDTVNGLDFDGILKSILVTGIAELFDDSATKDDIEELKTFLVDLYSQSGSSESKDVQSGSGEVSGEEPAEEAAQDASGSENAAEEAEPETVGDYSDDTIAENFSTLQNFISQQVHMLNDTISKISKAGIGSKVAKMVSNGFKRVTAITSSILSKVKSASSTVLSIGKSIAGGTFAGLAKTVGFIAKAVGSIGVGIGTAMTGIKNLAGGIAGMGKKIGGAILSPFKKIGSVFTRKRADKSADRKERMREKFMSFMTNMFEKLWNFLEPVLAKLKIYMLVTLVPVLVTAFKVLAIIAAITAIVVGFILLYMFVKNTVVPKIKKAFAAIGKKVKDFGLKLWNGIKALGEWLWYIVSLKWIVDFGKWLWKKLCEFGSWLYQKFIAPWLNPLMKKLEPFIKSLQNLVERIKSIWKAFKWDGNKSFFDNVKCIASIIKDAVVDWWQTSPIKTAYDATLGPIVESVGNLVKRIKEIWNNFKFDPNISFIDNLKNLGSIIRQAIVDWWKADDNPVRAAYNKYLKPIIDKITGWLEPIFNWIKKIFDKLIGFGKAVADKTKAAVGKVQDKTSEVYHSNNKRIEEIQKILNDPSTGVFKAAVLKAELAGRNATKSLIEKNTAKSILDRKDPSKNIPQQQVQNAMNTVNSISNMKQETNIELQKTGEEMTQRAQAEKAATQTFQDSQSLIGSQTLAAIGKLSDKVDKYEKDPNVVPLPMPYGPQRNAAMMED